MRRKNRESNLDVMRRTSPPVPPEEAVRRSLHLTLLRSFTPANVTALAESLQQKALRGDLRAADILVRLFTTPIVLPDVVESSAPPSDRFTINGPPPEEARASRARQLADMLRKGEKGRHALKAEGMTEGGLEAILKESPEWFRDEAGRVRLTERGRLALLPGHAKNGDGEEDDAA